MLNLDKALELVGKLERTRNYPREGTGVEYLARGLQKASDEMKIAGARIVDRCAETSEWCPTDADLMAVARDLARLDAVAGGSYDALAGAANHVAPAGSGRKCERCGGTGWVTREGFYSSAKRCACRNPAELPPDHAMRAAGDREL